MSEVINVLDVRSANRVHVPELEQWAENQRPKSSDHHDCRLFRYEGTNLYQWYSKLGHSVFEDARYEPFVIERHDEEPNLRSALINLTRFARHDEDCNMIAFPMQDTCDCGRDRAILRAERALFVVINE